MRKTWQIASKAINDVISETRRGLSEHHIFTMVDYYSRMYNASHLSYPPVVASSNNTTSNYITNSQITKSGDLVLLDAGCEYGGYASDTMRTWPVAGDFTKPQRVLYEVVLTLKKHLIDILLKEGGDTLDNLFEMMCIKLTKYLQELGLVDKSITDSHELCNPENIFKGMDVLDTPSMPRSLKLKHGMVSTVEPGIYMPHDNQQVPKEFRGFGIRVEDDILINPENQIEVLTKSCIKDLNDLENLFKEASSRFFKSYAK